MRAFLPSQSTFVVDSSGRAVAQSMTVWMPTRVAGRDEGSPRSACTVVAPQSRKKSAGFCLGRTMQRTCMQAHHGITTYVEMVLFKQVMPALQWAPSLLQAC